MSESTETPKDLVRCIDQTGKWMCWLKLDDLKQALATQGLRIVDAKDAAVLDASVRMPEKQLRDSIAEFEATPEDERTIHIAIAVEYCRAELARRGAKP